ncbi:hypothetical protein, partial [Sphingomonas sp.]|uniref:hypothetical protein n=1 Tax=Sphingomonas sp. TaxID=28214 RepID=UPI0035C7EACA
MIALARRFGKTPDRRAKPSLPGIAFRAERRSTRLQCRRKRATLRVRSFASPHPPDRRPSRIAKPPVASDPRLGLTLASPSAASAVRGAAQPVVDRDADAP